VLICRRRALKNDWAAPSVAEASCFLVAMTSLGLSVAMTLDTFQFLVVRAATRMQAGGRIERVSQYQFAANGLVTAAFFFGTMSMFNVTLLWLSLATDAQKLRNSRGDMIRRYAKGLMMFYVILGSTFITLIILNLTSPAFGIAVAASGVLIVICCYGWFKLRGILRTSMIASEESKRMLRNISRTAIFILVTNTTTLCLAAVIIIAPSSGPVVNANRLVIIPSFFLIGGFTQVAVMQSCHRALMNIARDKTSVAAVSSASPANNYASNYKHISTAANSTQQLAPHGSSADERATSGRT
jgi:predicted small integral membrane protein